MPCAGCHAWRQWLAAVLLLLCMSCRQTSAGADSPAGASVVPSVVAQGAYLARAANCVSCHTAPGGEPFAGGKAFQTPYAFLGRIYSSNITADRETGIGAWTEADFILAMRNGIAPGGRHLFPAFPYTSFTKLATSDISAIFAFLKTLPAVRAMPPTNSFWFRQRWVMAIWNWLFFTPGAPQTAAGQTAEWSRGAYLVEALGHCGACHRPRNLFMAELTQAPLSGGILMDEVASGLTRRWSAPDLTTATGGLGAWSAEDLRKYLKNGYSRRAGVFGPMNEVFANSLRFLTNEDIDAVVTYLKGTTSKSTTGDADPELPVLMADARSDGQSLYDKHCDECHLSTGHGALRKGPAVAGSSIVQARDPASLVNVILYGAAPSSEVPSAFDAYDDMPGFRGKLTDHEVATLSTFLRGNWGNRGGVVSETTVARQH